ncbi:MAG: hypothetical protein Q9162_002570 [Coniocarpon cinnabarinum]
MSNLNEDNVDYPPLNAMDYDLSMQSSLGDANFDNNIEMFMDPQFWPASLGNPASIDNGTTQGFQSFDLGDLTNSAEQKFDASLHNASTRSAPLYSSDLASPTSTIASPTTSRAPTKSDVKRESISKPSSAKDPADSEDNPMSVSAEEDKRRRNTAASARFRVKKKQREQAMEQTAKEMTEKCNVLDSRVKELEKENKLLKGLLTEKAIRAGKARAEMSSSSSDEDAAATRSSKRTKLAEDAR